MTPLAKLVVLLAAGGFVGWRLRRLAGRQRPVAGTGDWPVDPGTCQILPRFDPARPPVPPA